MEGKIIYFGKPGVENREETLRIAKRRADELGIFGHGVQVAIQVSMMAADGGLVRTDEDIIAIAGTHRRADAAIVITPVYSGDFFDLQVKEILCKPYSWKKFTMPRREQR